MTSDEEKLIHISRIFCMRNVFAKIAALQHWLKRLVSKETLITLVVYSENRSKDDRGGWWWWSATWFTKKPKHRRFRSQNTEKPLEKLTKQYYGNIGMYPQAPFALLEFYSVGQIWKFVSWYKDCRANPPNIVNWFFLKKI